MVIKELKDTMKARIIYDYLQITPNWRNQTVTKYRWERPEAYEAMLNTNGSVSRECYGNGGILRDKRGKPIKCYNGRRKARIVIEKEL